MQPRTALSGISLSILAALTGCCPKSAPPTPASAPATQHAIFEPETKQFTSMEARREEVRALIEEATTTNSDHDRAAFAFAAAERSSAELVRMVNAIDTARDVTLRNLSNMETTAYKAAVVRVSGETIQMSTNLEQGSMENTGRALDLGIQGPGFFKIKISDSIGGGVGYTRNGNFFLNNKGEVVLGMGDGYQLIPPLRVPPNVSEISVSQYGSVEVILPGAAIKTNIGLIKLTNFINPDGLQLQGGSIYIETAKSGPPVENVPGEGNVGQLVQGFLEASNVNLVHERLRLRFLLDWKATLMKIVDP